ncbi:hypothetical protein M426DRAFT_154414 [Hypoxylon sp. CI-4A]|nr:hypothetical protein M426DRAFT_154414 [Hypoxylon sp. CI-4A]
MLICSVPLNTRKLCPQSITLRDPFTWYLFYLPLTTLLLLHTVRASSRRSGVSKMRCEDVNIYFTRTPKETVSNFDDRSAPHVLRYEVIQYHEWKRDGDQFVFGGGSIWCLSLFISLSWALGVNRVGVNI